MLDLKRLQAFVLVAETGAVAKAAALLHVSESPLSRQIIALERELGIALFERRGRRLRLTAIGGRFLGQAQALLAQAAEVERGLDAGRETSGAVRLGMIGGISWHRAVGLTVDAVRRGHPGIALALAVQPMAALASGLRDGELDLVLVRRPLVQPGLVSRRLASEEMVLVAAEALGELTPARLAGLPWFEPPGRPAPALQAALEEAGLGRRQRIDSPDLATSAALARAGVGVLLTHASVAGALTGVRASAPPFACPPLEIHIGWARRAGPQPAAVSVVQVLLERHLAVEAAAAVPLPVSVPAPVPGRRR